LNSYCCPSFLISALPITHTERSHQNGDFSIVPDKSPRQDIRALELPNTTNGELDKENGADLDIEQSIEDDEHDTAEGGTACVRHIVLT